MWYVNNNNDPAGNSGTSRAPFDTLTQAENASAVNHTVFVFDGTNTATGYDGNGYTMNAGERLIGEHEGLTVDPDGAGSPLAAQTLHPANPGAHPTLPATGADVIDLDDGNEVRGLNLDPSGAGGGIAGTTGDVSGIIDDVNILDTGTAGTQPGLELDATTGTFAISNFTVSTNGATGVRAQQRRHGDLRLRREYLDHEQRRPGPGRDRWRRPASTWARACSMPSPSPVRARAASA